MAAEIPSISPDVLIIVSMKKKTIIIIYRRDQCLIPINKSLLLIEINREYRHVSRVKSIKSSSPNKIGLICSKHDSGGNSQLYSLCVLIGEEVLGKQP